MNFSRLALLLEVSGEDYIKPIVSYLEKHLGKRLGRWGGTKGIHHFTNSENQNGQGALFYIEGTKKKIRFNLKNNNIESIDIWNEISDSDITASIKKEDYYNFVQITKAILEKVKDPTPKNIEVELTDSSIQEARKQAIKIDGKSFATKAQAEIYLRQNKGLGVVQAKAYIANLENGDSNDEEETPKKSSGKKVNVTVKKGAKADKIRDEAIRVEEKQKLEALAYEIDEYAPKKTESDEWENKDKSIDYTDPDKTFSAIHRNVLKMKQPEFSPEKLKQMKEKGLDPSKEDFSKQKNLYILGGQAGTSKSYSVEKTLKDIQVEEGGKIVYKGMKEGKDYVIVKGQSAISPMYRALYDNNGKIIILDDADTILGSATGKNLLKAASEGKRELSYSDPAKTTYNIDEISRLEKELESSGDEALRKKIEKKKSGKVPNKFIFTGKIIIITNKSMSELTKDEDFKAIATRSHGPTEVKFRMTDFVNLMEKNIKSFEGEGCMPLPLKEKQQVLDVIKDRVNKAYKLKKQFKKPLSLRTFVSGLGHKAKTYGNEQNTDWIKTFIEEDLLFQY